MGSRIRTERERMGITQEQLAATVGAKHKSAINKIEAGRGVSLSTVAVLAGVFGQSLDWLVTGQYSGEVRFTVSELPDNYDDERRARLVRKVKALAVDAPDDVIDALLKNVEVFKKVPKE